MTAAIIEIYQRLPPEAPETGVLSWAAIVNDFKEFNSVHHVLPVERSRGLSKGRWVPFGRPMVSIGRADGAPRKRVSLGHSWL